jgi:hypothetical protein
VVQVHDLVDFVSGESELAGASAAEYVEKGEPESGRVLNLQVGDGVGYTVPQRVRMGNVDKNVTVSFRVRRIYGTSSIVVKSGDTVVARFKRERMTPGEMEHITLPRVLLEKAPQDTLTVQAEEAQKS